MKILVVEDEPKIRDVLVAYFKNEGWEVEYTGDGHEAICLFDYNKHDLIILDLMIQGLPGEEVCKQIREKSNVPLIMLTSKGLEGDTINGFKLGADDYITKPFRAKELVARIHALFRRVNSLQSQGDSTRKKSDKLTFNQGNLIIQFDAQTVQVSGNTINLTTTEFKLLSVLSGNPGKVFSRNDLSYQVQGYRYLGDGRSIDAHVKNLRKKLEPDPRNPNYIQTVIGSGYRFMFHPDEE
ncbi:MAG: two-component system response regulator [Bacilli bacterium]|nr:two-component system response regulator [Bacilli bacterium]